MAGQLKDRSKTTPAVMCIKILLHIFNFLYFLIGAAVLGLGAWIQVQLKDYIKLTQLYYDNTAYIMIGVGILILLVALAGFVCTAKDKVALLYMYAVFIILLSILQVAAGIAGAVMSKTIDTKFEQGLLTSIRKHDGNMEAWDAVQANLHCCGVDGPSDWTNSTLGNQKNIPSSCKDPNYSVTTTAAAETTTVSTPTVTEKASTTPSSPPPPASSTASTIASTTTANTTKKERKRRAVSDTNEYYPSGCHKLIAEKMKDYFAYIVGVCVGFVVLQIVGAVLACCLARKTSKNNYEQIY